MLKLDSPAVFSDVMVVINYYRGQGGEKNETVNSDYIVYSIQHGQIKH